MPARAHAGRRGRVRHGLSSRLSSMGATGGGSGGWEVSDQRGLRIRPRSSAAKSSTVVTIASPRERAARCAESRTCGSRAASPAWVAIRRTELPMSRTDSRADSQSAPPNRPPSAVPLHSRQPRPRPAPLAPPSPVPVPLAPVLLAPVPLAPVPLAPVPLAPVPLAPVPLAPVPLAPVPLAPVPL